MYQSRWYIRRAQYFVVKELELSQNSQYRNVAFLGLFVS